MAIRSLVICVSFGSSLIACTTSRTLDAVFFPYDISSNEETDWPKLVDVQPIEAQPQDTPAALAQQRLDIVSAQKKIARNIEDARQPIIDPRTQVKVDRAFSQVKNNRTLDFVEYQSFQIP